MEIEIKQSKGSFGGLFCFKPFKGWKQRFGFGFLVTTSTVLFWYLQQKNKAVYLHNFLVFMLYQPKTMSLWLKCHMTLSSFQWTLIMMMKKNLTKLLASNLKKKIQVKHCFVHHACVLYRVLFCFISLELFIFCLFIFFPPYILNIECVLSLSHFSNKSSTRKWVC